MPAPFVNYEYMRMMVEETMLSTAQRLAYVSDVDVFGGDQRHQDFRDQRHVSP